MAEVVFSPESVADYEGHPLETSKFALAAAGFETIPAPPPTRAQLRLAHDDEWIEKVLSGMLSAAEEALLEVPLEPRAHVAAVGGTLLAARRALESGSGLHAGGGAHHAFRDHGEGYCALNDIAVAILALRAEGLLRRAAVIDLDVHQGNGTASIFAGDPGVFTFSMHQADLYPERKERSTLDVELAAGCGDAEYYDSLRRHLRAVMDFKPELVVYQAGVDVWEKDRLGGLALTERGILDRDHAVRETCALHGVPVAVTLGGGYGPTPADTARLHAATLRIFGGTPRRVAA